MDSQWPPQAPDLRAYFAQHPGFLYDPTKPATSEFRRLCDFLGHRNEGVVGDALRQAFADTLGNQFSQMYGVERDDLSAWQRLCKRLGVEPIPEHLEAAQEAVWSTHCNIIDLIDGEPDGQVPTFPTKQASKVYSFAERKLFPKQCSTAGAILVSLLAGGPPAPTDGGNDEDTIDSLNTAFASINFTPIIEDDSDQDDAQPSDPQVPESEAPPGDTTEQAEEDISPLEAFFSHFSGFTYDSSKSATSEFYRLCRHMRWKRKSSEREEAYRDFTNAMAIQFGRKYGADMNDLEAWQRLCRRLEVDPIPDDLEEARETVFNTYVNLVDLVDEGEVRTFDTEEDLSSYSKRTRKIFSRARVSAAGQILASLLRYIDSPPPPGSRRTSTGILVYN